jgi:hypothetical protein
MQFEAEWDDDTMNFYTLVSDTSTGKSKLYYGSAGKGLIKAGPSAFNLPSNPL